MPDLDLSNNYGVDNDEDDSDDVYLGHGKHRIARVSYDRDKNNRDLSSIEIYKQYLDDEDENENDQSIPYGAEQCQTKLDRYINFSKNFPITNLSSS